MSDVVVVVSIIILIVSMGFNGWLFHKAIKIQRTNREQPPPIQDDAATSLHRELNSLRQQRFGVPMKPRTLKSVARRGDNDKA